jgi:hypothetical protein
VGFFEPLFETLGAVRQLFRQEYQPQTISTVLDVLKSGDISHEIRSASKFT